MSNTTTRFALSAQEIAEAVQNEFPIGLSIEMARSYGANDESQDADERKASALTAAVEIVLRHAPDFAIPEDADENGTSSRTRLLLFASFLADNIGSGPIMLAQNSMHFQIQFNKASRFDDFN